MLFTCSLNHSKPLILHNFQLFKLNFNISIIKSPLSTRTISMLFTCSLNHSKPLILHNFQLFKLNFNISIIKSPLGTRAISTLFTCSLNHFKRLFIPNFQIFWFIISILSIIFFTWLLEQPKIFICINKKIKKL